jgi:perosamine synthetase
MTNLQAALGVAQLERIEQHIEKKRLVGNLYNEGLKICKVFNCPATILVMPKIFIGYMA